MVEEQKWSPFIEGLNSTYPPSGVDLDIEDCSGKVFIAYWNSDASVFSWRGSENDFQLPGKIKKWRIS